MVVGRAVCYAAVLLLSLIPAFFLNTIYGFLPFLFLILLLVLSLLYAFLLKKSFMYEEQAGLTVVDRGRKATFGAFVQNTRNLVFPRVRATFYLRNMFGDVSILAETDCSIAPKEKKKLEVHITFAHLGDYTIGLKSILIYDLLGLFHFTFKTDDVVRIHVNPIRYDAGQLEFENGEGVSTAQLATAATVTNQDYSGVREYVQGDPIKNIHWKLSAHSLKYLTKKFDNFSDNGITFYLDVSMQGHEKNVRLQLYDTLVESLYSVACDALEMGQDVQIVCGENGEFRIFTPKDEKDVEDAAMQFPPVHATAVSGAAAMLRSSVGRQAELDNVLVFTSNLTTELMYEMESIKLKRKNPQLFYVIPQNSGSAQMEQTQQIFKFLADKGIFYYVVETAAKLKESVSIKP